MNPHQPTSPRKLLIVALAAALASTACPLGAQVIGDDFDDGNDVGWTRANPLDGFGSTASFSFPEGNRYRINITASPDPGSLGDARAGSVRGEATYTDFRVAVDVVGSNAALQQDIGLLARISTPGLGMTRGYAWSLDTDAGELFLSRLDNEAPTGLARTPLGLTPQDGFRLVLHGFGGELRGEAYALDDLATPVAEVTAFDDTYPTGTAGVFASAGTDGGRADATFDNYASSPDPDVDADGLGDPWEFAAFGTLISTANADPDGDGQPNRAEFIADTDPADGASRFTAQVAPAPEGGVRVTFPAADGRSYRLEASDDLSVWAPVGGAVQSVADGEGTFAVPTGAGNGGRRIFRVVAAGGSP